MGLSSELLLSKPCLAEAAGGGSGQVPAHQRIGEKAGKRFLGQQDPAVSLLLDLL